MSKCARVGCRRQAKGDEFCSSTCCQIASDVEFAPKDRTRNERRAYAARVRRLEKKIGGTDVAVVNERVNAPRHEGPGARNTFGNRGGLTG